MLTMIMFNCFLYTGINFSKFDNFTIKVNFWHLYFTKNLKVDRIRVFDQNFEIFFNCLLA